MSTFESTLTGIWAGPLQKGFSMNRYHAFLCSVLFCGLLFGSEQRTLQRTYSTFPAADALKRAIRRGDVDIVRERMAVLPLGIDSQYAYLGLARSFDMCSFLLDAICSSWVERIKRSPQDALKTLHVGLTRLYKSFPLDELDHGFRCTLAKIRRAALLLPRVAADPKAKALASSIPDYFYHHDARMIQAYREAFEEHTDLSPERKELLSRAHRIYTRTLLIQSQSQETAD